MIFPPPIIREAVETDAVALATLMGDLGYPVQPEILWSRIKHMSSPSQHTFVAEIDDSIAGFIGCSALAIYESDLPTAWIMALSVAPRFPKRGIGHALLLAVESWCVDHGIPDIRLHSGASRCDAHAFYEAAGFHRAGLRFKKSLT